VLALPEPANQLCDPHHKTPDFRMLCPTGVAKASPALRGGVRRSPEGANRLAHFNDRALAEPASARGEKEGPINRPENEPQSLSLTTAVGSTLSHLLATAS
jgi:hypothetical protein